MGQVKSLIKQRAPRQLLEARRRWLLRRAGSASSATNAQIFSDIYANKQWGGEEHQYFSGHGSHDPLIYQPYVDAITAFVGRFDHSLDAVDLGCGDFFIGRLLRPIFGRYVACDVVPELVEHNRAEFADADVDFECVDMVQEPLPHGDAALVRQVLQHLSNDQIKRVVPKLAMFPHVIVTEHHPDRAFTPNLDLPTGRHNRSSVLSGIDLTAPPFEMRVHSAEVLCDVPDSVVGGRIVTTAYEPLRS